MIKTVIGVVKFDGEVNGAMYNARMFLGKDFKEKKEEWKQAFGFNPEAIAVTLAQRNEDDRDFIVLLTVFCMESTFKLF